MAGYLASTWSTAGTLAMSGLLGWYSANDSKCGWYSTYDGGLLAVLFAQLDYMASTKSHAEIR